MSSVKRRPDSTQMEEKTSKKRTKSSASKKSKKTKRETKKRKDHKGSDHKPDDLCSDDDSDLDLSKPLSSISSYVKDVDGMVKQMFHSITTVKLHAMLPEILKDVPLEDLKKLCLEELEVMSRKRILSILDGADPDLISSSEESESSDDEQKTDFKDGVYAPDSTSQHSHEQAAPDTGTHFEEGELIDMTSGGNLGNDNLQQSENIDAEEENITEIAETSSDKNSNYQNETISDCDYVEVRENIESTEDCGVIMPGLEEGEIMDKEQTIHEQNVKIPEKQAKQPTASPENSQAAQKATTSKEPPKFTRTQMEILELEMRARAIKAMLRAHSKAPP